MTSVRIGFHRGWAVLMFVLVGVQLLTYAVVHKPMYLALAALWAVMGLAYLLGTCFVVDVRADGSGEVQVRNPLGMTLKRHPFARPDDLSIHGRKLTVTRTDGIDKTVGGMMADRADLARLARLVADRAPSS